MQRNSSLMDRLCQSIMQSISLKGNNTLTSACMLCHSICLQMTKLVFTTKMKNTIFSLSLVNYSRTTVSKKKQKKKLPFLAKVSSKCFCAKRQIIKIYHAQSLQYVVGDRSLLSPEVGGERKILGDHVVFKRDGGGRVSHRYKYEEGIDSQ